MRPRHGTPGRLRRHLLAKSRDRGLRRGMPHGGNSILAHADLHSFHWQFSTQAV